MQSWSKKHDDTEEMLNTLIKLLEGKKSSLKQTKKASATTRIGYALPRLEDTSTHMGKVEKSLAKVHEEMTENNELLEETFHGAFRKGYGGCDEKKWRSVCKNS